MKRPGDGWVPGGLGAPRDVPGYAEALDRDRQYQNRRFQIDDQTRRAWEMFRAARPDLAANPGSVSVRCPYRHILFILSADTGAGDPMFGPYDVPHLTAVQGPNWKVDPDDALFETTPGGHVPGVRRETWGDPEDDDYAERDPGPDTGDSAVRGSAHLRIVCPVCAGRGRTVTTTRTRSRLMYEYLEALAQGRKYLTLG